MRRSEGLRLLGLAPTAGPAEVQLAYRRRCLPLKTQVLCARRASLKDRHLDELRALVRARDAALGKPARRVDPLGLNGRRLIRKLRKTSTDALDGGAARAFFGLPPQAAEDEVEDAYAMRKRSLIRTFANSHDDDELADILRARQKLRTIRNFALA